MPPEALVPAWVPLVRWFVWPALAFLVVWGHGELALVWLQRRVGNFDPALHWSERARRATGVRRAPWLGFLCGPITGYWGWSCLRDAGAVGERGPALAATFAACAAFALVSHHVKRVLGISHGLRAHLRSLAFVWVLLLPVLASALLILGCALGDALTSPLFFAAVVALVGGNAGGGILLARALGLARPASARTQRRIAAEGARLGVSPHAVMEIDLDQANALALPVLGVVVVTRRAEALLTEDELAAVLRHELAHLSEPLGARVLRLLPSLAVLACLLLLSTARWSWVVGGLVGLMFLRYGMLAFSRRMERRADRLAGPEGIDLAVALARMHEANLLPAVSVRASSHPHLYERMLTAGHTPDFPHPAPPWPTHLAPTYTLALSACVLGYALWLSGHKLLEVEEERGTVLLSLALFGPSAHDLGRLASLAWEEEPGRAADCYRAAAELEPKEPWWPFAVAMAEARRGACPEARTALERAEALLQPDAGPEWDELRDEARSAVDECSPR